MTSRRIVQSTMVAVLAFVTFLIGVGLLAIMWHILSRGLPEVTPSFLLQATADSGRAGGILPGIISTMWVTGVAVAISVPLGVGAAVYLAEYARQGRVADLVRFGTSSLAGIPSVVFGLFGFTFFVIQLGMGWSVMSGGLTMALMILPGLIRTAEEAIRSVPPEYLEGSLALGAPKWRAVFGVVVPAALPGIMSGVLLGIGRSFGETAALILTAGSAYYTPTSIWQPARTMAVHLYILASEGLSLPRAYGTAAVLSACILIINVLAHRLAQAYRVR
ncbi:MAG: phosphate ABC transporter permease PstA [Ignavibacteriales bacterium]